jgi:hypothetical protein
MPKLDNEIETHDIYLAAYLLVAGCSLESTKKQGARKIFLFKNPAGSIQDLRQAYFSGAASVKAHEYAQKIIAMKNLVHE